MFPADFQAVIAALGGGIANQLNASIAPNTTLIPTPATASSLPWSDMSSLLTFILSFNGLSDWLKLFILGGLVESARRLVTTAYNSFLESFLITVHFEGDDVPYAWLMVCNFTPDLRSVASSCLVYQVWLSKQGSWTKARSIQVSSNNFGSNVVGGGFGGLVRL